MTTTSPKVLMTGAPTESRHDWQGARASHVILDEVNQTLPNIQDILRLPPVPSTDELQAGMGNCFQVAMAIGQQVPNVTICHGIPIGRGPDNHQKRFWHGWVELIHPVGPIVMDFSNGKSLVVKRAQYYRLGQINGEDVYRFPWKKAVQEALTRAHFGPWVDDWESMCEA